MTERDIRCEVPITDSNVRVEDREEILSILDKVGARRLWLAAAREMLFDPSAGMDHLRENVRFFKSRGVEVGIWINGFGFGVPAERPVNWQRIVSVSGAHRPDRDEFCPEDPGFSAAYTDLLSSLASLGPDLIMLDDDLCLSARPGIGCFCPIHQKMISERLGEPLGDPSRFPALFFIGGPNRYRDAWYRAMGDSMKAFCRRAREAVDRVDPSVRLGFCAGYTNWTFEGIDCIELARILAGSCRPFFRLTSAPYWVADWYHRFSMNGLQNVIENARAQSAWCRGADVEFFAEADSYPRPAYHVGESLLENFDTALCADGVSCLKYMLDYNLPLGYENSYIKAHLASAEFRDNVAAAFKDSSPAGVRLFCRPLPATDLIFPDNFTTDKAVTREYFSSSAQLFTGLGVPVNYSQEGRIAAAFGNEALNINSFEGIEKLVLDLPAALILKKQGFDVGFVLCDPAPVPDAEIFGDLRVPLFFVGKNAAHDAKNGFFSLSLEDCAEVLSEFVSGTIRYPSAYRFRSGSVELLVCAFDGAAIGELSSISLSYARAEQLHAFAPVYPYAPKTHGLYQIFSRTPGGFALLVENLGDDKYSDLEFSLPFAARSARLFGAEGSLEDSGRTLKLRSVLYPKESFAVSFTV